MQKMLDLDPDAMRCPHRYLGPLRSRSPVVFVPEAGFWAVLGYAELTEALRRTDVFSSGTSGKEGSVAAKALDAVAQAHPERSGEVAALRDPPRILLYADPPLHTAHRALVREPFHPRILAMFEQWVTTLANELVDAFIDRGEAELVEEYADPIPLIAISRILGVPEERYLDVKRWSDDFVATIGEYELSVEDFREAIEGQLELRDLITAELEDRLDQPADDLLTTIAQSRVDDRALTTDEMVELVGQLLIAGNETTVKLIASGVLLLCERPELTEELRADPALIPNFTEEVLRLESPSQGLWRVTLDDVELGGVTIPADSLVWVAYAGGNRDPEQFDNPDELDIHRPNARTHLAFGLGPHFCLGAPLARLEGRIAFEVLLRRLRDIRLHPTRPHEFASNFLVHGLESLPVTFLPA